MASTGHYHYYHQSSSTPYSSTPPHNNHHHHSGTPPLPLHLCFFLLTLFLFVGVSWYLSYESALERAVDQLRVLLVLSPLALLLAVHWLSSGGGSGGGRRSVPFAVSLPERDSFHRAGGSPWGVGLVLVLLLFMVSYQSSFQERWFPLLSR
ncbi:uncharacterized protein M6B38_244555 [Iris pallida]|uniref:Transmembrane protein n=1 Tax=Iris pallida TaxID=29817 RepID=A0AAX6DI07_IRIPA|nr:uncharacterized protein M6B38_244555 [Iris pallida]